MPNALSEHAAKLQMFSVETYAKETRLRAPLTHNGWQRKTHLREKR